MNRDDWHVTAEKALARVPTAEGKRFAAMLSHGSLSVEIYAPRGSDPQTPHSRDEVYVILAGRGDLVVDGQRRPFGPGDVLFVPARAVHRFEGFGDDFATWVFFYGPEGGEASASAP